MGKKTKAAEKAAKTSEKKAVKKSVSEANVPELKEALAARNKVLVKELLDQKILKFIKEEDKEEVYEGILSFKDMDLASYAVKNEKKFPSKYVLTPDEYKEYLFMQDFFQEFAKKIELADEDKERIFSHAVACNAPDMVAVMLKKKDFQESFYVEMASGAEEVFDLLLKVKTKNVSMETKRKVALAAIMADKGTDRVEVLENHGWDFNNIMLLEDLTAALADKKYGNDRNGRLDRQNDDAKMRFAQKRSTMTEAELKKEDKNNIKDKKMSLKELLTGKEDEKTYTQLQREKKAAQKLAREKKRRQAMKSPELLAYEAKRAQKKAEKLAKKEAKLAEKKSNKSEAKTAEAE